MANAFPLAWPTHYKRTSDGMRKRAAFKKKFGAARDELVAELKRMGAQYVVISSNVKVRSDGLPYSGEPNPKDPGVAVYFEWNHKQVVLACDKWMLVENNIRAVGLTIKGMRMAELYGVSSLLERAFQGFAALPAPSQESNWADVLGVPETAPLEEVEVIYKLRCKQHHPDRGGSDEKQAALNEAIKKARLIKGTAPLSA